MELFIILQFFQFFFSIMMLKIHILLLNRDFCNIDNLRIIFFIVKLAKNVFLRNFTCHKMIIFDLSWGYYNTLWLFDIEYNLYYKIQTEKFVFSSYLKKLLNNTNVSTVFVLDLSKVVLRVSIDLKKISFSKNLIFLQKLIFHITHCCTKHDFRNYQNALQITYIIFCVIFNDF